MLPGRASPSVQATPSTSKSKGRQRSSPSQLIASARFPASGMPSQPERSALASQSRAAGEPAYSGRLRPSRAAKYMSASSPPSTALMSSAALWKRSSSTGFSGPAAL